MAPPQGLNRKERYTIGWARIGTVVSKMSNMKPAAELARVSTHLAMNAAHDLGRHQGRDKLAMPHLATAGLPPNMPLAGHGYPPMHSRAWARSRG